MYNNSNLTLQYCFKINIVLFNILYYKLHSFGSKMKKNNYLLRPIENRLKLDRTRSKDIKNPSPISRIDKSQKKKTIEESKSPQQEKVFVIQSPLKKKENISIQKKDSGEIKNLPAIKIRRDSVSKIVPVQVKILKRSNSVFLNPKERSIFFGLAGLGSQLQGKKNSLVTVLIGQMLSLLADSQYLSQANQTIEIKKDKFITLIQSIFSFLSDKEIEINELHFLEPILVKISEHLSKKQNKKKCYKLMIKKEIQHVYSPEQYKGRVKQKFERLSSVKQEVSLLESRKNQIQQYYQNLLTMSKDKQRQLKQLTHQIFDYRAQNQLLYSKNIQLITTVTQKQILLNRIVTEMDKLTNHRIPKCQYDYNFKEIMNNYTKIQSNLYQFLRVIYSKLKYSDRKDHTLFNENKIQEFYNIMSQWITLHDSKHQYLAKLRAQFLKLQGNVSAAITKILSTGLSGPQIYLFEQLRASIETIERNYKLGNKYY